MKRSVKLVFSTNVLFLIFSTATSLLSAWALGADGRGSLTVITMWTFVFALAGTLGLPYAHRYWIARKPEWNSEIFSNTIVFTLIVSVIAILVSWQIIPHIINEQKPEVIRLTQLFLLNIPIILLSEMLRGHLEGAKIFDWRGAARLSFIATQAVFYLVFYAYGWLTLENALLIIVGSQIIASALMLAAVLYKLRPRWKLSFKVFRAQISYGFRSYFGIVTEFAVWRLDQVMLTAMASSKIIGLYAVAVAEISATLASSISDSLMPEVASSKNPENRPAAAGKITALNALRASFGVDSVVDRRTLYSRLGFRRGIYRSGGGIKTFIICLGFMERGDDRHQRFKRFRKSRFKHGGANRIRRDNCHRARIFASALGNDRRGGFLDARLRRNAGSRFMVFDAREKIKSRGIFTPATRRFNLRTAKIGHPFSADRDGKNRFLNFFQTGIILCRQNTG